LLSQPAGRVFRPQVRRAKVRPLSGISNFPDPRARLDPAIANYE
jgi:hypothetical protein